MKTISIKKPFDAHIHLRDGDYLARTVPDAAKQFSGIIVMPNLQNLVDTVAKAESYCERIQAHMLENSACTPHMTLYLTPQITSDEILKAAQSKVVKACKLYPSGATTNSSHGIANIQNLTPVFEAMSENQIPLLIHGEVVDYNVDIFDREKRFIDDVLVKLVNQFPKLKIVLEHITTKDAVQFVGSQNIAATITAHHLLLNRNDLFVGGVKPHHYCLPVLKRRSHQEVLIQAAISGNPKFFLGTDSAPHAISKKESACGCAGIYTAHAAIELYTEVFQEENALDKLENFASIFGPSFYHLNLSTEEITLTESPWRVPEKLSFGNQCLVPFRAGEPVKYLFGTESNLKF